MSYQLDATGAIRDQTLVGDTVVMSDDNCTALIRSTLTGGALKFAQPKKAGSLVLSTVRNCVVDAIRPQRTYQLFKVRFINCRFRGVFSGIDFGRGSRTELHEDFGSIESCDFTDATLDDCRFFEADVSAVKFPRHGHAVLLEPYKRATDVGAVAWPGLLGRYMEISTEKREALKALVMHIPSLAGLVKCTEDEARDALQKFGGVVM